MYLSCSWDALFFANMPHCTDAIVATITASGAVKDVVQGLREFGSRAEVVINACQLLEIVAATGKVRLQ